jgi:hypothetical protein
MFVIARRSITPFVLAALAEMGMPGWCGAAVGSTTGGMDRRRSDHLGPVRVRATYSSIPPDHPATRAPEKAACRPHFYKHPKFAGVVTCIRVAITAPTRTYPCFYIL